MARTIVGKANLKYMNKGKKKAKTLKEYKNPGKKSRTKKKPTDKGGIPVPK